MTDSSRGFGASGLRSRGPGRARRPRRPPRSLSARSDKLLRLLQIEVEARRAAIEVSRDWSGHNDEVVLSAIVELRDRGLLDRLKWLLRGK